MKRQIFFEIPDQSEYRILCQFGYHSLIQYSWYCYIQKRFTYKKWIFFGEVKSKWVSVNQCWFSKDMDTLDDLKNAAMNFYDESVLMMPRIAQKAMDL